MDSCPRPEAFSTWAQGALSEDAVAHLAACESCRDELVQLRRIGGAKSVTERVPASLKSRLYGLTPSRRVPYAWFAAAAALVLIVLVAALREKPADKPIVQVPPKPKPPIVSPAPAPEPQPPPPVVAKPAPEPEKAPTPLPEPPKPVPAPEAPVVVKPVPAPEKPAPVPEKPAPALTRAKLRGSLTAVAGSAAVQIDSDAWQSVKIAQSRDFMGLVKVKADVAAAKFRVGANTYYVQRGGELALTLEEGRTQVRLARGEAFFDVASGPFEVESALGSVAVKGTRFLVSETDVAVQRGTVQLNSIMIAAGERSTGAAAQKADLGKRLAWLRTLEETLTIETDTMALAGGLMILPDPTASGGRAIGIKDPLKAGQEAVAEIRAKKKQPAPYAVWIRLHWAHNVPSSLSLAVGDALKWTSKDVTANPQWQWVRAGAVELPDEAFRIRLTDTKPGMRIDQLLITSDLELVPESK